MSNTHGIPNNPLIPNTIIPNQTFNPIAQAAEDLPFEAVENVMEDFAKHGLKGKGLIAQTFKHPVLMAFLKKRTLTFPILMAIAALAAKVGQKFGMGNALAAILYEFTKHSLAGFAEGAHEAIKMSDEQREEQLHRAVDEMLTRVPDVLPDLPENLFKGRIRKGDSIVHSAIKDCSDIMKFTDGYELGSKIREKMVYQKPVQSGKKGDQRTETVVKELKADDVEYHHDDIVDLLRRGNTYLCKLCFPDGIPKGKPKEEEHHAKGLKDKLGQKAIDLFLAANATIAAMGTGKLFAIDEIQEWKDIDPDLIKAAAERLHPKITADGKLPRAELEELLTLIPTAGVEKLSAINAVGKAIKTVKEFAGESTKKEMKPILEEYSPQLIDFLRATENRLNGMDDDLRTGFAHLEMAAIAALPDLSELDEYARQEWSTKLRKGEFKDDPQFILWNETILVLAKAHEYDRARKNPTLRALANKTVGWLKTTRLAGILLSLAMVAGWLVLGFKKTMSNEIVVDGVKKTVQFDINGPIASIGMILIIGASVGLVILALLLLLPEWALKAGDIFFPKWNKTDETFASVRWKLSAAIGILFVNGCLAYFALVPVMGCLMIFGASIVLPIVTSALLRLGGAYVDLLRSQRIAGLIYSGVVGAIPAALLVSILLNANPELHDEILRGVMLAVLAGVFLVGAWKVTTMILAKTETGHGHSIAMVLVACVAGAVLLGIGYKVVQKAQKTDLSQIPSLAPAGNQVGISGNALGQSGDALEAAKQKALALKAGTATNATPPVTTPLELAGVLIDAPNGTTPAVAPVPEPTHGNAKHLTKAQAKAEIAKLEKALKKDYGDDVPALAELEKQEREFAKRLTAINAKFGSDTDGLKADAEYQEVVQGMERLSGEINLRKQIEEIENGQKASPKPEANKPVASTAVASEATEAEGGPDEGDGLKAYCQKLARKAPLVFAQTPTCQGV